MFFSWARSLVFESQHHSLPPSIEEKETPLKDALLRPDRFGRCDELDRLLWRTRSSALANSGAGPANRITVCQKATPALSAYRPGCFTIFTSAPISKPPRTTFDASAIAAHVFITTSSIWSVDQCTQSVTGSSSSSPTDFFVYHSRLDL